MGFRGTSISVPGYKKMRHEKHRGQIDKIITMFHSPGVQKKFLLLREYIYEF